MTGRYVQPKRELRAFLLIDMKDSTGIAERLGPVRFHELLNDFFRDVADAALECERRDPQICRRRGDPDLASGARLADGDCLPARSSRRDFIERTGTSTTSTRFGAVPTFRASLHYGEIVAGEIGDVRREIAYVGDTLNVAARLLDAAKELGPRRAGVGRFARTDGAAGRHHGREAADAYRTRPGGAAGLVGAGGRA